MFNERKLSTFMCKILRHEPKKFGLEVDEYGFCSIDELVNSINQQKQWSGITREDILYIVQECKKQRYEVEEEKIRTRYGHSYRVRHKESKRELPSILYHGTNKESLFFIINEKKGLLPMQRDSVHLSETRDFANLAAKRRKEPRMLKVSVEEALNLGVEFKYVGNEVWLSTPIPVSCLEEIKF
ncbi:RNA 2'-phosphotransferase [Priestia filamentosa]|uniref:RNA 2'-phosphotransferase n=1 Tax=Priestia filamentosa TaxID=1402861 RepID=UPI000589368D